MGRERVFRMLLFFGGFFVGTGFGLLLAGLLQAARSGESNAQVSQRG